MLMSSVSTGVTFTGRGGNSYSAPATGLFIQSCDVALALANGWVQSELDSTPGTSSSTIITGLPKVVRNAQSVWKGGVPIANEAAWPDGSWTLVYGQNSRKRYIAVRSCGFVRLVYAAAGGLNDGIPTAPFTIRASLEPTNGATRIQFTFNGRLEGIVQPGGILVSDPVSSQIAAGQQFWVWTYGSSPNQFYYSPIFATQVAWGEGCDAANNAASSDKTPGTTTLTANNVSHFSPIAVIGDAGIGYPFVGHFGDSIGAGLGDYDNISNLGRGFLRRAMGNAIPFINLCVSGDLIANSHYIRYGLYNGCTDVITHMGINDLVGGASLSTMQTNMVAEWQALGAFGARVWQCTITPKTSSTDTWATTVNQTPFAGDSVRQAVNNWIRAGSPLNPSTLAAVAIGTAGALLAGSTGHPLTGYFETADAVETSRNSGIWKVGYVYTTDGLGIHPNSEGSALLASAINTTGFLP
jgi:hypothetical protein